MATFDDDREVLLTDEYEGLAVLPDQSTDDTDVGWGERPARDDDDRLLAERPPHWG